MAVTASVRISAPTSEVSPRAVLFDAKGSTADGVSDPFIDLTYEWTFTGLTGTWSLGSGDAKSSDKGPVALRVFEVDPDDTGTTFSVSCKVTNPANGETDTWNGTVDAHGRNVEFPTTDTVCLSTTADFTGAPAGSTQITTTDLSEINTQIAAGKRCILLHAGQSWSYSGDIDLDEFGPGIIGKFGAGNNPVITTSNQTRLFRLRNIDCRQWTVMDVDFTDASTNITFADATGSTNAVEDFLMLRCKATGGGRLIFTNANLLSVPSLYKRIHIVECTCEDQNGNIIWTQGQDLSVVGCDLYHTGGGGAHLVRNGMVDVGVFSHSNYDTPDLDRHHHKLHGGEFDTDGNNADALDDLYTQYVVLRRNQYIYGAECTWGVMLSPQNNAADERLRLCIVECCYFQVDVSSSGSKIPLTLHGDRLVSRCNIFQYDAGTTTFYAVSVGRDDGKASVNPGCSDCRVLRSSIYRANSNTPTAMVHTESFADGTVVHYNLGSAPSVTGFDFIDDEGTNSLGGQNSWAFDPGWDTDPPTQPSHYQLTGSSSFVDFGSGLYDGLAGYDYNNASSPSNAKWDYGAWELQQESPVENSVVVAVESLQGIFVAQISAVESTGPPPVIAVAMGSSLTGSFLLGSSFIGSVPPLILPTRELSRGPEDLTLPSALLQFWTLTTSDGSVYRFVDFADPEASDTLGQVTFNGEEYFSIKIGRPKIEESTAGRVPLITVQVMDPFREVMAFVRDHSGLEDARVRIDIIEYRFINDPAQAFTKEFRIRQARSLEGPSRMAISFGAPLLLDLEYPIIDFSRASCPNLYEIRFLHTGGVNYCSYPSHEFEEQEDQIIVPGTDSDTELFLADDQASGLFVRNGDTDVSDLRVEDGKLRCQGTAIAPACYVYTEIKAPVVSGTFVELVDSDALVDVEAELELDDPGSDAYCLLRINQASDTNNHAKIGPFYSGASRQFRAITSDSTIGTGTTTDRYFRIEVLSGSINFYRRASEDDDWTLIGSDPHEFIGDVEVGIEFEGGGSYDGECRYLRFNKGGFNQCDRTRTDCEIRKRLFQRNAMLGLPEFI